MQQQKGKKSFEMILKMIPYLVDKNSCFIILFWTYRMNLIVTETLLNIHSQLIPIFSKPLQPPSPSTTTPLQP